MPLLPVQNRPPRFATSLDRHPVLQQPEVPWQGILLQTGGSPQVLALPHPQQSQLRLPRLLQQVHPHGPLQALQPYRPSELGHC